jgi:hypothetical protein
MTSNLLKASNSSVIEFLDAIEIFEKIVERQVLPIFCDMEEEHPANIEGGSHGN